MLVLFVRLKHYVYTSIEMLRFFLYIYVSREKKKRIGTKSYIHAINGRVLSRTPLSLSRVDRNHVRRTHATLTFSFPAHHSLPHTHHPCGAFQMNSSYDITDSKTTFPNSSSWDSGEKKKINTHIIIIVLGSVVSTIGNVFRHFLLLVRGIIVLFSQQHSCDASCFFFFFFRRDGTGIQ